MATTAPTASIRLHVVVPLVSDSGSFLKDDDGHVLHTTILAADVPTDQTDTFKASALAAARPFSTATLTAVPTRVPFAKSWASIDFSDEFGFVDRYDAVVDAVKGVTLPLKERLVMRGDTEVAMLGHAPVLQPPATTGWITPHQWAARMDSLRTCGLESAVAAQHIAHITNGSHLVGGRLSTGDVCVAKVGAGGAFTTDDIL